MTEPFKAENTAHFLFSL